MGAQPNLKYMLDTNWPVTPPHVGYQQFYYTRYILAAGHGGSKRVFLEKRKKKSFSLATGFNLIVGKTNKDNIPVLSEVVQAEELKAQS